MDKSELLELVMDRYDVRFHPSRNGWQSVRCPNVDAHSRGDSNPSARISMQYGVFVCHGCGLSGDGYTLLMEIEGLTFPQAKEQLGSEYVPIESEFLL